MVSLKSRVPQAVAKLPLPPPRAPSATRLLSPAVARGSARLVRRVAPRAAFANGNGNGTVNGSETRARTATVEETPQETTAEASQRVLEWSALCRQVACCTQTSMGAAEITQNGLYLATAREESEKLLEQTAQALAADLSFEGIHDVTAGLEAISNNPRFVFSPMQLSLIGVTLLNAQRMFQALSANASLCPLLHEIAQPVASINPELLRVIQRSIRATDGFIYDAASPDLAQCRRERKENASALQKETEKWSQKLFKEGVCERPIVVFRRDRRCIPVKNGRQGQLPKGSVRLAQSGSGLTVYMEPEPIVQLNNKDALLHSQIRHHERRVITQLSKMVLEESDVLKEMMDALKELDVVYARARHAQWAGSVRPRFLSELDAEADWQVCIPGAVHPLLLEPSLDPLPQPPSARDDPFMEEKVTLESRLKSWEKTSSTQKTAEKEASPSRPRPQSLELTIPKTKTVVALTGPNTGGKTATLKTLGLCVLMAKSGLYLPVEPDATRASIDVHLKWFDKVLADIGDSQSLQQSLSTFSGHVRRLTHVTLALCYPCSFYGVQIMDEVCRSSLVLLDEIGTGTDPTEGAALAAAVLTELSEITGLTVATTHHAEIKELADAHPLFLNASMEFNAETLKPTYQLIWGSMGQSNALDICSALKFDPGVVDEARNILQKGIVQAEKHADVEKSLQEKLLETFELRDAMLRTQKETKTKLHRLEKEFSKMKANEKTLTKKIDSYQTSPREVDVEVDWVLSEVKRGDLTFTEAESCLQELLESAPQPQSDAPGKGPLWYPEFHEMVRLKHLGGKLGKVLSKTPGKMVIVECKNMKVEVPIWYLEPVDPGDLPSEQLVIDAVAPATAQQAPPEVAPPSFDRLQTDANTLDLRGMYPEDAHEQMEHAMQTRLNDDVLFIVHGRGTGRLRDAVRDYLRHCQRVRDFADEPNSDGGCTIALLWV